MFLLVPKPGEMLLRLWFPLCYTVLARLQPPNLCMILFSWLCNTYELAS